LRSRQNQVSQILGTPVIEKPEDLAKAIWEAVKHQRDEVIVGSANLSAQGLVFRSSTANLQQVNPANQTGCATTI
jgi:hypothetical protein